MSPPRPQGEIITDVNVNPSVTRAVLGSTVETLGAV